VTPAGTPFTSLSTAAIPRTTAPGIVSRALARQTPCSTSGITFFTSHTTPTMKDKIALMIITSALTSLIIALLFHMTAVMPVITALMKVIAALMSHVVQLTSVMAASMTDIAGAMPFIVQLMSLVIGTTPIMGKILSLIVATMTDPDRVSPRPPLALD
jgi:hypothetical protein